MNTRKTFCGRSLFMKILRQFARPFGARGRSSVRYGTRLGDLKRVGLFCFPIKDSTHTPHGPCHSGNGLCHVTGGRNHPKGIFLMVPNLVRASSPTWLNFVSVRRIKESSSSWIFARIWTFSTTTNYIFSKFFDTTNYIFDHHKEKSNHNKKEYFRIYRITDVTDSRLELRAGRIFSKLHFTDVLLTLLTRN